MTIRLPPEIESSIQAAVHSGHFASVEAAMTKAASLLLDSLKREQAQQPSAHPSESVPRSKSIWEVAADLRRSVPPEDLDKLPIDGAAQHDHYIYGTRKRPTK